MSPEIPDDYRVQELLAALNEGLLDAEFVRKKLVELTSGQVELIKYPGGQYDILLH